MTMIKYARVDQLTRSPSSRRPSDQTPRSGARPVVLAGYDAIGAKVISWGQHYTMTWAFFEKFVDEAYAIADPTWITARNQTPGGLSIQQLEQAMQELKSGS